MPGISVSKIPIPLPFNKGGGISWSSYWATRTPSALVLTVLSETSIRLNWTANGVEDYDGYSVERSADGTTFAEIDTVLVGTETFTDTGLTANHYWYRVRAYKGTSYSSYTSEVINDIPLTIYAGSTFLYDYRDTANITVDGSNKVSSHKDKLGSGHDLLQATGAYQPTLDTDGILFPSGGQYKLKTAAFTWNQPVMIYAVVKQLEWKKNRALFDGNGQESTMVCQYDNTPEVCAYAGTISAQDANLTLNTWGIIKVLFNGASSKLQVNENAAITGNFGAQNAGGFTFGNTGTANTRGANVKYKEIIGRSVADSAGDEADIYDYLAMHNRTEIEMFLSFITGGTRVEWIDADNVKFPCDTYEIWVSVDGGAYSLLDTVAGTETTYEDLVNYGTSYTHYKVRARRGNSFSAYSDAHTITADLVFTLTANGDGSGVGTLCFEASETVTMTLTGTARFYTNLAATEGESLTADIIVGALRTFYVKVPSGTATLTVRNRIIKWGADTVGVNPEIPDGVNTGWYNPRPEEAPSPFSYPNISIDASTMGYNTSFNIYGCNTIYGNISGLPLKYIEIGNGYTAGNFQDPTAQPGEGCSITGDVARFTDLVCLDIWDKIHLTGDISGLTHLMVMWMAGSNLSQFTGSVEALTDLRWFQPNVGVSSPLSGSLAGLTMLYRINYSNENNTVTIANVTNLKRLNYLRVSGSLTEANTNQLLADMWANRNETKPTTSRLIDIDGTPSGQGVTDKNALIAAGWTVTTN